MNRGKDQANRKKAHVIEKVRLPGFVLAVAIIWGNRQILPAPITHPRQKITRPSKSKHVQFCCGGS